MTLNEKISKLAMIKLKVKELYEIKSEIEQEVFDELKQNNLKSVKTDNASATLAKRKNYIITSEEEVIKQLDEMKLKSEYVYEALDKPRFVAFAKEMIKNGKEVNGVDIEESEYLLVKNIDKE